MAKLSARGRTEVFRVEKTDGTTIYRRALMSDRTVLKTVSYMTAETPYSKPFRTSTG